MFVEDSNDSWTNEEVKEQEGGSFNTSAYVRRQLAVDAMVSTLHCLAPTILTESQMLHKDCCKRKGGADKRIADAVRDRPDWEGKESLDSFAQEGAVPPSYVEAAPAYSAAQIGLGKTDL